MVNRLKELKRTQADTDTVTSSEKELDYALNFAIKGVTEDAEKFQFNTAIARMMELVNVLYKYDSDVEVKNLHVLENAICGLLKLLAPFAPHFAEEMWEKMGYSYSIFNEKWPEYSKAALVQDVVELGIQINGRIKEKIEVPSDMSNGEIEKTVLSDSRIIPLLEGRQVKKVIIVKGRLVNIVLA
jgi:leucyl-tRNA synthetase